jgi:hypothetical protein
VYPQLEALEPRLTPSGNVSAAVDGSGNLVITGDSANNAITLSQPAQGQILIAPDTTTSVNGQSAGQSVVLTGITNDVLINMGAGQDTVAFQGGESPGLTVEGNVAISGTGSLHVTADLLQVNGALTVNGGSGDDSIAFTRTFVGGDLNANLGGGSNVLSLTASTHVGGNLTEAGDTGAETFLLGGTSTVSHHLSINDPGATALDVTITDATIDTFLSVIGGGGAAAVSVQGTSVGENLGFDLGAGTSTVTIAGSTITGNLFEYGDTGTAQFSMSNSTVDGYLSINDPTVATLNANITTSTVENFLSVIGGSGNDTATILGTSVGNTSFTEPNLGVNLGGGTNTFTARNDTIVGSLFEREDSGTELVTLTELNVQGHLAINEANAASVRAVIRGSTIGDGLTFVGGAGNSILDLTDSTVSLATNSSYSEAAAIFMGAGNDTLNIEFGAHPDNMNTSFQGPVQIRMGPGNDSVTLGQGPSDLAVFSSSVTLDGGLGTNTLIDAFASFQGGPPTISNFG